MNKVDFKEKFNAVLNSINLGTMQKRMFNELFNNLVENVFSETEVNKEKIDILTSNLNALTNLVEDNNKEVSEIGNIDRLTEKATIKDIIVTVNRILFELSELTHNKLSTDMNYIVMIPSVKLII